MFAIVLDGQDDGRDENEVDGPAVDDDPIVAMHGRCRVWLNGFDKPVLAGGNHEAEHDQFEIGEDLGLDYNRYENGDQNAEQNGHVKFQAGQARIEQCEQREAVQLDLDELVLGQERDLPVIELIRFGFERVRLKLADLASGFESSR